MGTKPSEVFSKGQRGEKVEITNPRKCFVKDERYIDGTIIPYDFSLESFLYRDEQKSALENIFYEALQGNKAPSAYLDGRTGTGKTILTQLYQNATEKILKSQNRTDLILLYVECKDTKSNWGIATKVVKELIKKRIILKKEKKERGLNLYEYCEKIFSYLEKEEKKLILILDEIEKPIRIDGNDEFLFELGNRNEEWGKQNRKSHITVISITNDRTLYSRLKIETQSRLGRRKIHFDRYKQGEILGLLKQRYELALNKNVEFYESISVISAIVGSESGNLRNAIELFNQAFRFALGELVKENEDPRKTTLQITRGHVMLAKDSVEQQTLDQQITLLKLHEKLLFLSLLLLHKVHDSFLNIFFIHGLYKRICSSIKMATKSGNEESITYISRRYANTVLRNLQTEGLLGITEGSGRSAHRYSPALDEREITTVLSSKLILKFPFSEVIEKREEFLNYYFKSTEFKKLCERHKIPLEYCRYTKFTLPNERGELAKKEIQQHLEP